MNLRESFPELSHEKLCSALAEEFRQREGAAVEMEDITEGSELTQEPGFQVGSLSLFAFECEKRLRSSWQS